MPGKAKEVASKSIFVPLRPKRNFEEVATQIKELILSGQLKPFERLPSERELAEQFNASRNTVREAYRILEETGFIRMKTGNTGGALVCTPDGRRITQSLSDLAQMGSISLQEITQSRLTLELAALEESFPHFDAHQIAELETCLQKAEEVVDEPDNRPVGSRRSDLYNFHVKLAEASQNRVYVYLVTSLVDVSNTFLNKNVPQITSGIDHIKEHRKILDALKIKNKQVAKDLLKAHILWMDREISRLMAENTE